MIIRLWCICLLYDEEMYILCQELLGPKEPAEDQGEKKEKQKGKKLHVVAGMSGVVREKTRGAGLKGTCQSVE